MGGIAGGVQLEASAFQIRRGSVVLSSRFHGRRALPCVVAGPHEYYSLKPSSSKCLGPLSRYQHSAAFSSEIKPMKIFNWMHSKLYPSVKYSHVSEKKDVFGGDERENMEISDGMIEEEALLLHDVLHGILAIGTLGRKVSFVSQSYCSEEDEIPLGDKMNVETDVEAKDKDNGAAASLAASKPPALIEFDLKLPVAVEEKKTEMVVEDRQTAEKIQELPLLMEDKEKREQRVTLADLFAADASTVNDLDENPNKKMNVRSKQYLIIHNKKVQNRKEAKWQSDTTKGNANNRTKKLQKLITKLLKKKVHPEIDATTNVADMQMKKSRKPLMPGGAKSIE